MATDESVAAGTLYLVGTPIGNLEDITLRALRTLKDVDLIACEDTRQTIKLLNHYGIEKPTVSYHEHNELTRAPELIVHLEERRQHCPGHRCRNARSERSRVSAGDACGPPSHPRGADSRAPQRFCRRWSPAGCPPIRFASAASFPPKAGARRTALEAIRNSPRTQIFYEAPHRIVETLRDIVEILGPERHVVIAREVTKLHEEFLRGRADSLLEQLEQRGDIKGEITASDWQSRRDAADAASLPSTLRSGCGTLMHGGELEEKAALKQAAREFGLSKSEAYRELQRSKKEKASTN